VVGLAQGIRGGSDVLARTRPALQTRGGGLLRARLLFTQADTQNQALSAILFLYRDVLKIEGKIEAEPVADGARAHAEQVVSCISDCDINKYWWQKPLQEFREQANFYRHRCGIKTFTSPSTRVGASL
jgi:hypothetical protein